MVVRNFARANNGILDGNYPELDSTNLKNRLKMKWAQEEERKLQWTMKVDDILEMWQGSENLGATQKKSCPQNRQMTAMRYISDDKEIVKASWSTFQHNGMAEFKLSETLPVQSALSAKNIPGERMQVWIINSIIGIDWHPAESDEDSAPECISVTENWLNRNGDFKIPNDSKDNWKTSNESDQQLDNGIEDQETPGRRDVRATPNVPGLIRPTLTFENTAQKVLMIVNILAIWRNQVNKKM